MWLASNFISDAENESELFHAGYPIYMPVTSYRIGFSLQFKWKKNLDPEIIAAMFVN